MSKETMIVFVYDTECLKDEADDPVTAVLYFHPSWVSDTQKVALCGQLMGSSYFLRDCFFKPRIIALQNGKFVLREFGRFILAVGTDRNISDYLLEHRANLLSSLIRFFHLDLQTIYDQFSQQAQYKNLSEKLYHIFETYLPILQYNGNIFQNVPKLRLPKTASNIFLDAIQTLQCCQQTKGILGGAILYHNKVVATQLGNSITKKLVLTDPLHIRTTAEQLNATDFHIPNGVLMLIVYIDMQDYTQLASNAQRAQTLQTTNLSNQNSLPFQYAKRKMKRDKSLIFTHIPEEESGGNAGTTSSSTTEVEVTKTDSTSAPLSRPKSLHIRPTHLPLRTRNLNSSSKELPESGIASINFDETDSYPEFIGRTSVCSTPMAENKVLQVGNIMSICANPDEEPNSNKTQTPLGSKPNPSQNNLKSDFERFCQNFISNAGAVNIKLERRNSFTDIRDSLKLISKKLTLKQFSNGFAKTDVNRNGGSNSAEPTDFIENGDEDNFENSEGQTKTSLTITDPTYPMYNANGQPISRSLFQEFLERYYKLCGDDNATTGNEAADETKKDEEIAQLIAEFKEFEEELKKLDECLRKQVKSDSITALVDSVQADRNLNITTPATAAVQLSDISKVKTPMDKRALSLPLKNLTSASDGNSFPRSNMTNGRRQSGGSIPLTPLMAKLSVLAAAEQNSNWDTTPAIEIQTPLNVSKSFPRRSSVKCDDAIDALHASLIQPPSSAGYSSDSKHLAVGLQRTELYICGQQNMTMLLLMEEGSAKQQQIVQKMFDICVAKFPHMESQLNQTLNVNVEGDKRDGDYSFISIDAKWDALQRKGAWNPVELNTLEYIHRDLHEYEQDVTDLILRSHDTVFYGYKSGRAEYFYKEPVHNIAGIPPPSDPMGNVQMRAKARLESDHFYNLF